MQRHDAELTTLIEWLEGSHGNEYEQTKLQHIKRYSRLVTNPLNLSISGGLLCYQSVPVMPDANLKEIVTKFPVASGHMDRDRTFSAIKVYYYNSNMSQFVTNVVKECVICQEYKGSARSGAPKLKRVAAKVYDQFAIDLLEVEPTTGGVR